MRKICRITIIALSMLIFIISSCNQYEGPYTFWRQDSSNIEKIEICSYDEKTGIRTFLAEIPDTEIEEFVEKLSELDCSEYYPFDPIRGYGEIQVCIIYSDGEIELIGFLNIGYISPDGTDHITNYCVDDPKDLFDLICEHVDPELLSYLSKTYPSWFETTEAES
jgi:hypothetical protein